MFIVEEDHEEDANELLKDVDISGNENIYIANEDDAVKLISELVRNETDPARYVKKRIEQKINRLFSLFSEVTLENEMSYYKHFMDLCSRLSARQKIQKLRKKVVVSFGGAVSAGKSSFINALSGIGDKLPIDQNTCTAIPTYIIGSDKIDIRANSVYGYSTKISEEALIAMANGFKLKHRIGFPSFVESIIVESPDYALSKEIALLDTPGYTNPDGSDSKKTVVSDRERAREQLSVSDYLIWLINIEAGTITEEDIRFIDSLGVNTPILIVFNKADKLPEATINQIVEGAKKLLKTQPCSFSCFGITAYSSKLKKEYGPDLIPKFLKSTVSGSIRGNDILAEFRQNKKQMREAIVAEKEQSEETARELFAYISKSEKVQAIRSFVYFWGEANQNVSRLNDLLEKYDSIMKEIDQDIKKFFEEGEQANG